MSPETIPKKEAVKEEYRRFIKKRVVFIIALLIITPLLIGYSATLGSADISVKAAYDAILHKFFPDHFNPAPTSKLDSGQIVTILWTLRLPRIVLGIVAGCGLAIAGAVMQAILRNPLASPYTLGIASAASFGASLAIILGVGVVGGEHLIIANAFVFSMIAASLIYLLSIRKTSPETMVLAGIAIMYLFSAMTSLLQYVGEAEEVQEVVYWMFGSLGRAKWSSEFPYGNIGIVGMILLITIPYLLSKSWDLNAMGSGDEAAKSLGVKVEQVRISCMFVASLITASIICFTGTIGFIGLVCPHITRMVIGSDHRFLLPGTCLTGAVLLLAADTLARTIVAPVILPVGIVTAFMGVPLFVYLLMRQRGGYW
ncbi:MAG: iron ABC transporter permease [Candidatus Syntrophoarchaeum sp. WYZ-LMO15]|nr:MAG: iron ABC transporter permease [Candidatus Syntrophoarchaeum sp. WYZ-LMO15]